MPKPAAKFACTKAEEDAAQLHFDWLLPYRKALLTTTEAAACLGRRKNFVRELAETGRLEAFEDTAFGTQKSLRITRRSVLVHLARTAKLAPEDSFASILNVVETLSRPSRERLLQHLARELKPKSAAALPGGHSTF